MANFTENEDDYLNSFYPKAKPIGTPFIEVSVRKIINKEKAENEYNKGNCKAEQGACEEEG